METWLEKLRQKFSKSPVDFLGKLDFKFRIKILLGFTGNSFFLLNFGER